MDQMIKHFCNARDYLYDSLPMKIKTFMMMGGGDLVLNFQIISETNKIVKNELIELFPMIPENKLPQCRFRIHEDTTEIEVGIQNYYNHFNGLTYIGTSELGSELFDCYYRNSYDPQFDYRFIVVLGHGKDDYLTGSKTAEAEYYLGQKTPLAIAYGLAYEQGFLC